MAPKVSKFAKTAAKRKAAPKKTVQKDKTPEKAKKTPEKTKPVAEETIEEAQKQLQEKMDVDVPEKKPAVKVEQVETTVSKQDQSSFVSAAKKTNNEDMQKAYKRYQSLGRYDKQKQDRKFSPSVVFFVLIFHITCHHSYSKPFQEIVRMWKTDKSCKWFVSWSKSINNEETSVAKGREGFGTRRYEIVFFVYIGCFHLKNLNSQGFH